jgi:HAE1 family hydrophobic/amphiphilic exporter-1
LKKEEYAFGVKRTTLTNSEVCASQATAYKSEIDVKMIDQSKCSYRDAVSVYAAKNKKEARKSFGWCKSKTVPVGILYAEDAKLGLIVTGPDNEIIWLSPN